MREVAIVHDYLTQRGGAERVVLAMTRTFPDAPVYTSLFDPVRTFDEFSSVDVRPSALNASGTLRRNHRLALPLLAPLFSRMRIEAEVVICSSSGWAHGIATRGRKLVYCYTPARWLYQSERYLGEKGGLGGPALVALSPVLRRWDRHAAVSADAYLAISTVVASRIHEEYGITADVLFPPHTVAHGRSEPVDLDPGFYLCIARLLPYKNVLAVVQAFSSLSPRRLVVVGGGPQYDEIRRRASGAVTMLGGVTDEQLRWLYAHCRAVVAASHEDYGLTPVEGASWGKPSIVLRWGGFLDTVVDGATGVFFDEPDPPSIARAILDAEQRRWDDHAIREHAERFSERRFAAGLMNAVNELRGR